MALQLVNVCALCWQRAAGFGLVAGVDSKQLKCSHFCIWIRHFTLAYPLLMGHVGVIPCVECGGGLVGNGPCE